MPRPTNPDRLQTLQQAIKQNPGQPIVFFAHLLCWPVVTVVRLLTSLHDQGVLLSEDEHGGLWPFE